MSDNPPTLNTDRELFREDTGEPAGSYYENHVFVTEDGHIGMNVGGMVFVKPIADWHSMASGSSHLHEVGALAFRADQLSKEMEGLYERSLADARIMDRAVERERAAKAERDRLRQSVDVIRAALTDPSLTTELSRLAAIGTICKSVEPLSDATIRRGQEVAAIVGHARVTAPAKGEKP